jgi:uracil-DNA glycosylase
MQFDKSWQAHLLDAQTKTLLQELNTFIRDEEKKGKTIYPARENIYAALNATAFEKVKVVILGQDPYHGPGQAHGLSFSVPRGVKLPPSLQNIFKELHSDLGLRIPSHGNLSYWAEQGVLLLNTTLTVEAGQASSHQGHGWELFTDKIIQVLSEKKEHLVFILWGSPAQKKAESVDQKKHLLLKSVHPSPLSSYRGFFGSKPFSKANDYLRSQGIKAIDWQIPD